METVPTAVLAKDTFSAALSTVLEWLDGVDAPPLDPAIVPGTTPAERSRLRALGWLLRTVLDDRSQGWDSPWAEPPLVHEWLSSGPTRPAQDVLNAMSLIANGGCEIVARLYVAAVGSASRRRLGTFFTPTIEARWMVNRWQELEQSPATVVDVGAGVGLFTREAASMWPDATVHAIDINPVTLGLLSTLVLSAPATLSNVQPVLADYVAWLDKSFDSTRSPRLVLGNPPYTRLQLIPIEDRAALLDAASPLCGARASLSTIMLAASLLRLGPKDGLCFLLPALWLEADYARGLRQWLWSATSRRVEIRLFQSGLFEDAQVDAVALVVGGERTNEQPLIFGRVATRDDDHDGEEIHIDRRLDAPTTWRHLDRATQRDSISNDTVSKETLATYANVSRGLATGRNAFFTLSEDDVRRAGIEADEVVDYLQRTRGLMNGSSLTRSYLSELPETTKRFVLCLLPGAAPSDGFQAYVAEGERMGVHGARLSRDRRNWWDIRPELRIPDVIIGASATSAFAVVENLARAAITNNLFGLTWHPITTVAQRAGILRWLRSEEGQAELMDAARTQAGGLKKLEVRSLLRVRIPASVAEPSLPSNVP